MTNQKSNKRALLLSALSLLMCVSMLIGSTFAWFTDSVASGSNVIQSGNLDLVVEYTLDGKTWKDLEGADDLFRKGLWEPGHTEVVALRIKNNGSLALKYVANMNITNETVGKTATGADIVLSDILTVSTMNMDGGPIGDVLAGTIFTGEDAVIWQSSDITTSTFKQGNILGENQLLLPGASKYVLIKVDMDETVGNEANHNGTNVPTIEFGLNILATQFTYENDSFGNQYDANVPAVEVIVDTTSKLEAALEAGNKIIGVEGTAVELAAARAGQNRDVGHVTLVGLTDDATITVTGTGGGLENINLKNLKVVDSTFYTSENGENAWEFTYLELGGNNTFVNVAFDDGIMTDGPMSTFVDCTFSGHNNDSSTYGNTTMYGAWVYNGKATFTGCYFSGTRGLKVCDQYAGEVSKVVVDSCVFGPLSEKPGLAIDDRDASSFNIVVKNCYFIECQAGDQDKYIYETDNYVPSLENNTVVADGQVVATAEDLKATTNGDNVFLATNVDFVNTDANNQLFIETEGAINFNGIGNTISVSGSNPTEGNHNYVSFLPPAGESAKIENVTVTGEGFVEVGDYSYGKNTGKGEYTINNLVVKDLTSTLAVGNKGFTLAAGFCHYGNAVLNDCVMTGTTNMVDGAMPVDAAFTNSTTTFVNRGEYGVAYCYEHTNVTFDDAKIGTLYVSPIKGNVTVKAGTEIEKLVVDYGTSSSNVTKARLQNLVIEDGAAINEIVYAGNTYTVDTWNAFVASFGA